MFVPLRNQSLKAKLVVKGGGYRYPGDFQPPAPLIWSSEYFMIENVVLPPYGRGESGKNSRNTCWPERPFVSIPDAATFFRQLVQKTATFGTFRCFPANRSTQLTLNRPINHIFWQATLHLNAAPGPKKTAAPDCPHRLATRTAEKIEGMFRGPKNGAPYCWPAIYSRRGDASHSC